MFEELFRLELDSHNIHQGDLNFEQLQSDDLFHHFEFLKHYNYIIVIIYQCRVVSTSVFFLRFPPLFPRHWRVETRDCQKGKNARDCRSLRELTQLTHTGNRQRHGSRRARVPTLRIISHSAAQLFEKTKFEFSTSVIILINLMFDNVKYIMFSSGILDTNIETEQ